MDLAGKLMPLLGAHRVSWGNSVIYHPKNLNISVHIISLVQICGILTFIFTKK